MSPPIETAGVSVIEGNHRAKALLELVEDLRGMSTLPPAEQAFDAVVMVLTDALLDHDQETLSVAGDVMRPLQSNWVQRAEADSGWAKALGRLQALLAFAFAGAQRLTTPVVQKVASTSRGRRVLSALSDGTTVPSEALRERTGLSSSALSHASGPLLERGLITREQVGKGAYWTITPQGSAAYQAAARKRLKQDPAEPSATLVEATTWKTFDADLDAVMVSSKHRNPVDQSRLLCANLVVNHQAALTTRLFACGSLGRFAARDHIVFAVPPLDSGKTPQRWKRALENAVRNAVGQTSMDLGEFWPAAPPAFDTYGVVHGRNGRGGVVLVKARLDPREFRLGKPRVKPGDREQFEAALHRTSTLLGAKRDWQDLTAFPDATGRLAMLAFLHERNIPAWLFNLYFVRAGTIEEAAPRWWKQIDQVRRELAIVEGHNLSAYVEHGFVEIPESARLALAA